MELDKNLYNLHITKSAEKELRDIPFPYFTNIVNEIQKLKSNPRPIGSKKLKGTSHTYRIRISDYRVVYTIKDNILYIEVIKIAHRSKIYKKK